MEKAISNQFIKIFLLILSIILLMAILGVDNESYALKNNYNSMGDYVLNPKWVEYMELSSEEQGDYDIIPEKFIYQYKMVDKKFSFFRMRKGYPEYYNLNNYGESTFPDNQGELGLCWAFAGMSSIETNMLKTGMSNINNPIKFSVRQLDYASVSSNYIKEGYNPYAIDGRYYPGSGAYSDSAFALMATGISPVTNDIYGEYNESIEVKPFNEVFNLNNIEYVVDSYIDYGLLGEYSTAEEREAWIEDIKKHIMNYGSVVLATIGPLEKYAGSCIYKDSNNNYMLNVSGECNPLNKNNGHAMAIIGWDDNYEYEYCRLDDKTVNDLTNCDNIVSGKGAFILKNSWGDFYPYPYFSYNSDVFGSYGVTSVSVKNWDTNYDYTKSYYANYENGDSTITYHKSSEIKENLKKISFYSNRRDEVVYNIYLSKDGSDNYIELDTVITNNIGLNTIYVDDILLDSDKFSVRILSDNSYVDQIYAFTSYFEENNNIIVDTTIKTGTQYSEIVDEFSLYTVTKNVDNGKLVEYKFIDEDGNDVSNLVTVQDNYVLNNAVNPKVKIINQLSEGNFRFQTIYDGQIYESIDLTITPIKSLWSGGNGSVDDPFLISSVDDFLKIFTDSVYMKMHYKLIEDIDFSNISNWNIGSISNYQVFKGSLDGDNHIISGLKGDSNLPSLFYSVENASIKNLIFSNIKWDIEESGWANLVSILAYNSSFENIVITKSVNIKGKASFAGGIVATAYNSKFINIANYGDVITEYEYYGKAAGIVVESYGSEITKSYNYGNITASESIVGGIVAYLDNDFNTSNVGKVYDVYNYGSIKSNLYGGGIVGYGISSIIDSCYNVYLTNDIEENIGNIVGTSYGMVIKNCYYLNNNLLAIVNDEDSKSTLINVMSKTDEQLKNENTYLNFDFDNVWVMDKGYPYFKDFYYYYLTDIELINELVLDLGDVKKINIKYLPDSVINKKVSSEVVDDTIINVDEELNVTALKEGNTLLRIYTLDGSDIKKEIKITVIMDKINLDNYEIRENKYIKIKNNVSKESFINSINSGDKYKIKIFTDKEYLATGEKIQVFDQGDKLKEEYVAFVLGDTTGDGIIDIGDVAKLYQYIRGAFLMDREFMLASDVFKDSTLELNDVAKLYQYIKKGIESLEE